MPQERKKYKRFGSIIVKEKLVDENCILKNSPIHQRLSRFLSNCMMFLSFVRAQAVEDLISSGTTTAFER